MRIITVNTIIPGLSLIVIIIVIFIIVNKASSDFYHNCHDYFDYWYNKFTVLFQSHRKGLCSLADFCNVLTLSCAPTQSVLKFAPRIALSRRASSNFGSKIELSVERPDISVYRMPRTTQKQQNTNKKIRNT